MYVVFGETGTDWVHWAVSLALGVAFSAYVPEWTVPVAALVVPPHDHPDSPDSNPGSPIGFVAALAGSTTAEIAATAAVTHAAPIARPLHLRMH
ncbi:hypothetical protein GCM10010170_022130 [Dactylosporangium salmoneum]|uniref:Uncharacterized protein n=1 Tax=Dactylosporangium salmoneum TaxID=53361 RepID=A0ABP5SVG5_9ACTN